MRRVGAVDAPSAEPGGHVCWAFEDDVAFRRDAAAFLAEGAARGDRLVYVADAPEEELREHLAALDGAAALARAGALLVQPLQGLYEPGGSFDGRRQVETYRALLRESLGEGYAGLRVAADATALVIDVTARRRFVAYELAVDRFMAEHPMTAMCGYHRHAVGQGVADLFAVHPLHHGTEGRSRPFWAFHDADVVRLGGEVDLSSEELLQLVIDRLEASGDLRPVLDLRDATFFDVRSLSRLARLAGRLEAAGRPLHVRHAPPVARRCCELLGLDSLVAAMSRA